MATVRERQLDAAQRITHIGSWEWELATGTVSWSDELYRIYGLEPGTVPITLEWFLERLHPDDRGRIQGEIQAALARGGRFAYRERVRRPDGSVRQLDTVGHVLADASGRPTGLIGTCRDITEELRREEQLRVYADIAAYAQIGLSVWKVDDAGDLGSARLLASNQAAERATGAELGRLVGKTLAAVLPRALGTALPALLGAVGPETPLCELAQFQFDDAPRSPTFALKAFSLPEGCVALAVEDVSERTRAHRLQAGERRVLEMLASGAPLAQVLEALALVIEELAPETLASVLMLDETGTRLVHGAAPSLPEAYNRAVDGAAIGPAAGSCGTAAFRGEAVFVSDLLTDPLWEGYRELARPHGLRACWSTPVLANDGRVLGTFALYYREPRSADPSSRELVERASHIAGIAIERRRLDDQLRALSERIEAVREEERTAISREIHDELGQALTALKMDLAWVARRVGDHGEARTKLREMSSATDELLQMVRRISAELRPGVLDDVGLAAAIEWQAEEFQRRTGTTVGLELELGSVELARDLATAAFRIFQEALTNVARHAEAKRVEVRLSLEGADLCLLVRDDGVGLSEAAVRRGALGLLGMRERARRLGGDCAVTRVDPSGTLVSLRIPRRTNADTKIGR